MASQNIITHAKQRSKDDNSDKGKADQDAGVTNQLQQFFEKKNEGDMLMVTACDPEFIIWKHIGFTDRKRYIATT